MVLSLSFHCTVLSWCFHMPFTVYSRYVHSPFIVLSRSYHGPFTVLLQSFHSPCTVLSRSLNFPLMVISQSFHGLFTVFNVEPKSWSSSYAPLKQNLYLGDPPCPEVGPGASMPFIYILSIYIVGFWLKASQYHPHSHSFNVCILSFVHLYPSV